MIACTLVAPRLLCSLELFEAGQGSPAGFDAILLQAASLPASSRIGEGDILRRTSTKITSES